MNKTVFLALFASALLLSTETSTAKTRNVLLEATPEHQFGNANAVLVGNYILYQTKNDDESQLWSYNTVSFERTLLFTGALNQFTFVTDYIYTIGDFAYFAGASGEQFRFWKTDGTPAGTEALDLKPMFSTHSQVDGYLFGWSIDNTLLSTNGTEVYEHMINLPAINSICPIATDDVLAVLNQYSSEDTVLVRSHAREITNLSADFSVAFEVRPGNSITLGDACYVLAHSFDGNKELFMVTEAGEVKYLSQQVDLSEIFKIFRYQNRLYAMSTSADENTYNLNRFNTELTGFDASFSFPGYFAVITRNLGFTDEYIITQTTIPNVSPTVNTVFYLDFDLNHNESLGGAHAPFPTVHETAGGERFSAHLYGNTPSRWILSQNPDLESSVDLQISDSFIRDVITSPDSNDVFLKISDRRFGKTSIVKVADTPHINLTTAGIWHDPVIKNQGLVINQGQRANGSNYLFVSVYTQENGSPLWLAGVADIELPQASIEVELSQFEDTNFFEPETNPTNIPWGTITLEMTACDGLKATFNQAATNPRTINLVRIDNTSFNYLCSD